MMENNIPCPSCGEHQKAEQTYCNKCGINMQKIYWGVKEIEDKIEKPKKGSFEKKFFRGMKK